MKCLVLHPAVLRLWLGRLQGLSFSQAMVSSSCESHQGHQLSTRPSRTPFTAGQKLPGTDTAKLRRHLHLLLARVPAGEHSSLLREHGHGEEMAVRTIFPRGNATQVCLGETRRFLVQML